jgi:polysaccharide transporter, PST family
MTPTRGFVQGALLLAGAAMISKLLGSVYTIILQNIIGDQGMGLFQMAYPIYATLLSIATAGFPVAISKLVSEQLAQGDLVGVRRVLRVSLMLLSLGGVFCFVVLYFGADEWARIAGDPNAATAIRAISPALLLVPIMSAIRGYFQGYQWMEPTATSQVIEQFIRVITIIGLALWLASAGYGASASAAGAAFGAVTGAAAGLLVLGGYFRRRKEDLGVFESRTVTSPNVTKQLLYYALPISLGALVVPLMNNVDVLTVVNLLKKSGLNQAAATIQFGLLSGRAGKLMALPTTLAAGIGIAVMPAISQAIALGNRTLTQNRIDLALRMTLLLAFPATVGLILVAGPMNIALFQDMSGTVTIQVLSVAILFASLQTTTSALLQGAGWVYLPVVHLLIACLVKVVANLVLIPKFGIEGAAMATVISYLFAAMLNIIALVRHLHATVRWRTWVLQPLLATFIMFAFTYATSRQWERFTGPITSRANAGFATMGMLSVGIVVYVVALLSTGSLTSEELSSIPKLGPKLVQWCRRLGLLRE